MRSVIIFFIKLLRQYDWLTENEDRHNLPNSGYFGHFTRARHILLRNWKTSLLFRITCRHVLGFVQLQWIAVARLNNNGKKKLIYSGIKGIHVQYMFKVFVTPIFHGPKVVLLTGFRCAHVLIVLSFMMSLSHVGVTDVTTRDKWS